MHGGRSVLRKFAVLASLLALGLCAPGVAAATNIHGWGAQANNNWSHGLWGWLYTTNAGFGSSTNHDEHYNCTLSHLYFEDSSKTFRPFVEIGYYNGEGARAGWDVTSPTVFVVMGDDTGSYYEVDYPGNRGLDWSPGTMHKYKLQFLFMDTTVNPHQPKWGWYVDSLWSGWGDSGNSWYDGNVSGLLQAHARAGGEIWWDTTRNRPKLFTIGQPPGQIQGTDGVWRSWTTAFATHDDTPVSGCQTTPFLPVVYPSPVNKYQHYQVEGYPTPP